MRLVTTLIFVAMFLVIVALPVQAEVKDKGLILYFSFDQESGGKVKDETANKHDGTLNKATINTKEKKYGNGSLEAKDPQSGMTVESFKELENYQDNTYLFWLYFIEGFNGSWSQIIAKKAPGSDRSPGIWTCPPSLNIHWRFNPGNQGSNCLGPKGEGDQFDLKKWYHLAGVKDKAELKFYVNGEEKGKYNVPKDHIQGAEKLYIGATGYRAATFLIDELYVYDRALSEKEVKNVMDGGLLAVHPQNKLATVWGHIKWRVH